MKHRCVRFIDLLTFGGDVQQLADGVSLVVRVGTFEGEFELAPCGLVVVDCQTVHGCRRTDVGPGESGSDSESPTLGVPRSKSLLPHIPRSSLAHHGPPVPGEEEKVTRRLFEWNLVQES